MLVPLGVNQLLEQPRDDTTGGGRGERFVGRMAALPVGLAGQHCRGGYAELAGRGQERSMFGQGRQHRRWGLPEVESVHLGSLAELWEMGEVRHLDEPASAILGGATRLANRWGAPDTSLADYWCTRALFGGGLELLRLEASGCCGWRQKLLLHVYLVLLPCF